MPECAKEISQLVEDKNHAIAKSIPRRAKSSLQLITSHQENLKRDL